MSPPDHFKQEVENNHKLDKKTKVSDCEPRTGTEWKRRGGGNMPEEATDEREGRRKDLFLKVESLKFDELFDWSMVDNNANYITSHSNATMATMKGSLVDLNYKKIAVFRYGKKVFAVDEECPHLGGPLHLGDIETLQESNVLCIVCPWHKWRMEVTTGKVKLPQGRQKSVDVYPIKVDSDGSLWIAFSSLDPKHFNEELDF